GAQAREEPLPLLLVPVHVEVVHAEKRVREIREREARIGRGELLVHDRGRRGVHARATQLRRDRDAEEPELAQLAEARQGEALVTVVLEGLRVDLAFREFAHHGAQLGVLGGGFEELVHRAPLPLPGRFGKRPRLEALPRAQAAASEARPRWLRTWAMIESARM